MLGNSSLRRIGKPDEVKACGAFLRANCRSLEDSFRAFDSKSLGHLTLESFTAGMNRMGYNGPQAEDVFRAIDTNHTGLISLHAFLVAFAKEDRDGRSSYPGSGSRGSTPRGNNIERTHESAGLDWSISSQLSWPESLELALPPPAPSSGDIGKVPSGGGARSVLDLAQLVDKLRSELTVERQERRVELEGLKTRLEESRSQQQVDLAIVRGSLESEVLDLKAKLREMQEEAEELRRRLQSCEGRQDQIGIQTQSLGLESPVAADSEVQAFKEKMVALETSLRLEVEEFNKRVQSLENRQDQIGVFSQATAEAQIMEARTCMNVELEGWKAEIRGSADEVQAKAQQMSELQSSVREQVDEFNRRMETLESRQYEFGVSTQAATQAQVEAATCMNVELEGWKAEIRGSADEVQAKAQEISELQASVREQVDEFSKRMKALESRQDEIGINTQAATQAQMEVRTSMNVELEGWKAEIRGSADEVQAKAQQMSELQAAVQDQVEDFGRRLQSLEGQQDQLGTVIQPQTQLFLESTDHEVQAVKDKVGALETSLRLEVEEFSKRMKALEGRQDEFGVSTQAATQAQMEAATCMNVELEGWKAEIRGSADEVQAKAQEISELQASVREQVEDFNKRVQSLEHRQDQLGVFSQATAEAQIMEARTCMNVELEGWKAEIRGSADEVQAKAQEISELQSSVREQVDSFGRRLQELEAQKSTTNRDDQLAEARALLEVRTSMNVELEGWKAEIRGSAEEVQAKAQQISELQSSVREQVDSFGKRLQELEAQKGTAHGDDQSAEARALLEAQMNEYVQRLASMEGSIQAEARTCMNVELEGWKAEIRGSADEVQAKSQQMAELQASVQEQVEGFARRLRSMEGRQEELSTNVQPQALESVDSEVQSCKEEVRSLEAALRTEVEHFNAKLQALESQQSEVGALTQTAAEALKEARKSMNVELEGWKAEFRGNAEEVQAQSQQISEQQVAIRDQVEGLRKRLAELESRGVPNGSEETKPNDFAEQRAALQAQIKDCAERIAMLEKSILSEARNGKAKVEDDAWKAPVQKIDAEVQKCRQSLAALEGTLRAEVLTAVTSEMESFNNKSAQSGTAQVQEVKQRCDEIEGNWRVEVEDIAIRLQSLEGFQDQIAALIQPQAARGGSGSMDLQSWKERLRFLESNDTDVQSYKDKVEALETALRVEVEEIIKRMQSLESRQDQFGVLTQAIAEAQMEARKSISVEMEGWRTEFRGSAEEVRAQLQQIAALQTSVREQVDGFTQRMSELDTGGEQSAVEDQLKEHAQRISTLEGSIQAEVADVGKKMQVLEARQDQMLTRVAAEAHVEASNTVNMEIEQWKAQVQGSEAELQNHNKRLAALESASTTNGKLEVPVPRLDVRDLRSRSPSAQRSSACPVPPLGLEAIQRTDVLELRSRSPSVQRSASGPGAPLGLEVMIKKLEDLRQNCDEGVPSEARTPRLQQHPDEDRGRTAGRTPSAQDMKVLQMIESLREQVLMLRRCDPPEAARQGSGVALRSQVRPYLTTAKSAGTGLVVPATTANVRAHSLDRASLHGEASPMRPTISVAPPNAHAAVHHRLSRK